MVRLEFLIPENPRLIYSFIEDVMDKLSQSISISDKLSRRIKLILIEFSTNFIKHSPKSEDIIIITADHQNIELVMKNKGLFFFKDFGLKKQLGQGETIEINFSEANNHYLKIIDENKFQFLNPFVHQLRTSAIKNHYGLHIITFASDCFFYEYDSETNYNKFIACINIS